MKSTRYAWQVWKLIILLVVGLLACQPVAGWAQVSYFWNAGPGTADWGTPANWDPAGPPGATDSAILYVGDNSTKIADYNNTLPAAPLLGGVYINSGPTGSMTLLLRRTGLAGQLRASEVSVGDKSLGILAQQAGLLEVAGYLYVGNPGGSTGNYTLSGGELNTAHSYIGNQGTGIFEQSGGTHTVANELNVGYQASSRGSTYTLSNGAVNPQLLFVGYSGQGTFNQSGGTVTIADHLGVGRENGSVGEYNLDGGTFTTQDLYVGWKGQGVFNKGAGTLNVGGSIFLATGETGETTGRGTFNLAGGTLAVANLDVGLNGIGTFNQDAGTTLTIGSGAATGILAVNSQAGTSTFSQNGGNTTVFGNIEVGREVGSRGQYFLHGGSLATNDSLYVGYEGNGTFTQTGGSHAVTNFINLGDRPRGNGTYNLEGGTVTANDLYIGTAGTGRFNQSGATSQATFANDLNIINGTYQLSGGRLTSHNIYVGAGGVGAFEQSGASTVTIRNFLGIGRNAGGAGTYTLEGGTLLFAPPSGTTSFLFLGVDRAGTFTQNGGIVNLAGGTLQMGVETGGLGTYNLNNGRLQVGTIDLAVTGPATPGRGLFNLAGGTLAADIINLNPGGTFNQTGGTLNYTTFNHQGGEVQGSLVNNTSYVYDSGLFRGRLVNAGTGTVTFNADFTAGNGLAHRSSNELILATGRTLTLNGLGLEVDQGALFRQTGGTLTTSDSIIGAAGTGTFTQTGGIHRVTNTSTLTLGATAGSTGTYTLQNGTLNTVNTIVGNAGAGIFNHTGGTHTVTADLSLGREAGGEGTYTLGTGGILTSVNTSVGFFGQGAFDQTGGTHTVANTLALGQETGSDGAYLLGGGELRTRYTMVGLNGPGAFEQTGGIHTVTGGMGLAGLVNTSQGAYDLRNGNLIIPGTPATSTAGFLDIGEAGEGIFRQSGGLVQVTGTINLGVNAGSTGRFVLSGGTLEALNAIVPPAPDPVIAGDMFVGDNGTGVFTQTGGTSVVNVNNHLGLGRGTGTGTYNLEAGQLTTGFLFVGNQGVGTFNHVAGTHTITGSGYVGSDRTGQGTYNLNNGGILNVSATGNFEVGSVGRGVFNQNAGSTFTTRGLFVGDGVLGTFNQRGGATTVAEHLGVGRSAGGTGLYNLEGGTLGVGDLFVGYAGKGTFTQGTTAPTSGGTHTVGNMIYIGHETTGDGTYLLQYGSLQALGAQVGISGKGVFTQTGGTFTLREDLTLGVNPTGRGTVNLQGGEFTVRDIFLNPGGIFNPTGGTLTYANFNHQGGEVQGSLLNRSAYTYTGGLFSGRLVNQGPGTVAFNADFSAANGLSHLATTAINLGAGRSLTFNGLGLEVDQGAAFNQTGGTLNTTNSVIGNAGLGTMTQSNGSHTVSQTLTLANQAGSTGEYNLAGGTLTAAMVTINPGGTFNQTGGTFIPGTTCTVGTGGTFNQSGGIVDGTSNTVFIGEGTANLTGGTLRPGKMFDVRRGGTFNQTGGVVDGASNTVFIAEGTCNLSDGTLRPGESLGIMPGGQFTQTGGVVDGLSNTILINEGVYDFQDGTIRPGNSMRIQNGGRFTQTGGLVDGASNTISVFEGVCTVNGGTYRAGDLFVYTGGSFNWTGGNFSYNSLNLRGGSFAGNLVNTQTITGTGTITGTLTNNGNVNPGASPGTLNIVGSFTQSPAGTYTVEMASAAVYDQIKVSGTPGTAQVAGTLKPELLSGFTPSWNQKFPGIVTATGGVSGAFSTIDSPLKWKVAYNPTSIDLIFGSKDFADPNLGLTANQRRVGLMLNQVADTASGDLGQVLTALADLSPGAVGSAYQQISPDKATALPALSLAGSMLQWQSVANRLSYQRWRRGALPDLAGKGSGAFNLSYSNLAGLMLAYNSADMGGLVRQTRADSANRWGLWTDFLSSFGSLDSTVNVTGYDFSIFGFNTGVDYRLVDNLVLGFATGFTATNASFKGSGGTANVNSIPLYLYGAYTPGAFYVQGALGYTINLYSLDRNIAFSGVSRVATSSVDGSQLNVSLETGYDARAARFIVTPAVTLNYSQAWVGGFTESGAGTLNLRVNAQSADSLQTGVGLRLSRPIQSGQTLILPQISAFYQHEFAGDSRGLDARLAQAGSTFLFQTDSPSRDFALLGAGLALGLRKNLTLQATYNAEVGRGGYTPHVVSAGLRYEF